MIVCRFKRIKLRQYQFLSKWCAFNANCGIKSWASYNQWYPVENNPKNCFSRREEPTRSNFWSKIFGKLIEMVHYYLNAIKWRTLTSHLYTHVVCMCVCVCVCERVYICVVNMKFCIVLTLRLSLSVLWSSVNTALKIHMHSYDFYYVLSAIFFFHQKPSSCVQWIIP